MSNLVLSRQELKRLPFQRRPVAGPGTRLVFQLSDGSLVAPQPPYTSGEVWWRSPRTAFVVDTRPRTWSFQGELPCQGDALQFSASMGFTWLVVDPITVVREMIGDPTPDIQAYVHQRMRTISRRYSSMNLAAAETAIAHEMGPHIDMFDKGVRVTQVGAALRFDSDQATVAKDLEIATLRQQLLVAQAQGKAQIDEITQTSDLKLHSVRAKFYADLLASGGASMAGNMLAQDPAKAAEAADFMLSLWQRDQDVAMQAMKVILESDQLRLGEIDGAVSAAVNSFTALVSQAGGKLAPGALTGGGKALPAVETVTDGVTDGGAAGDRQGGTEDGSPR